VTSVYGGVPIEPQLKELRAGVEILVATPGRLLDHVGQRTANLGQVEILVLDEADRMLDMGFIPDIRRILALLPEQRQNLLFSATFNDEVRQLSSVFMHHPATVEVAPRNTPIEAVRQLVYPVDRERKEALLAHLIRRDDMKQVLVFTRTKIAASRLASRLDQDGIEAVRASDRSQPERIRALEGLRTARSWSSWRPTWPPAASTSRTFPTSSTSSSRPPPKTTSTGSAGPAGRAPPARPSPSCRSTRTITCGGCSGSYARPSGGRSGRASCPSMTRRTLLRRARPRRRGQRDPVLRAAGRRLRRSPLTAP
jgi:hypothetical protein